MESWNESRFSKFRSSEHTGSAPTERHAEYHGPARSRPWIIAAIALGLLAVFVVIFALNPTENNERPTGIASTEIVAAHV